MAKTDKELRLEILEKTFGQILLHIAEYKGLLLSPEGRCGTTDYGEGERYSISHTMKTHHGKKIYHIGYRINIGIQEE